VTHPKIGFVGLGQMGSGMASNLTNAGHQLYVHDQSASAMARFADINAICCQSLSEIAQKCSLVFLCLPSAKEVDEVLFGPKGLVDNVKAQISIIDTSTLERSEALQFHGQLAHKAIQYADCPVSGLPARAREGKVKPVPLVRRPLREAPQAIKELREGKALGRYVLIND